MTSSWLLFANIYIKVTKCWALCKVLYINFFTLTIPTNLKGALIPHVKDEETEAQGG